MVDGHYINVDTHIEDMFPPHVDVGKYLLRLIGLNMPLIHQETSSLLIDENYPFYHHFRDMPVLGLNIGLRQGRLAHAVIMPGL